MSFESELFESKFGQIPSGWQLLTLADVADVIDPQPDHRTPPSVDNGEPYIGISDFLSNGNIDWQSSRKVLSEALDKQQASFQIDSGDIIFGKIGTIGFPKFLPKTDFRFALSANVVLIKPKILPQYVMSYLQSAITDWQMYRELHTTSQPAFGIQKIRKLQIPLPPLEEQRKIAAILGTWDKAIGLVEQLIEALQARKKGLMQKLLTGEVRFAEFEGEDWEEVLLGDVSRLTAGGTPDTNTPEYWGNDVRWMKSGDVHLKRIYEVDGRISNEGLANSSAKILPINSVLIALAGQGKTRGTVAINKVELSTNQSVAAAIPNSDKAFYEYLFYNLDARYEELRRLSAGDGGRGGLNLQLLRSIAIPLPSISEQENIAATLHISDKELTLWNLYIEHLQEQKRGLMQALLTGQVRV